MCYNVQIQCSAYSYMLTRLTALFSSCLWILFVCHFLLLQTLCYSFVAYRFHSASRAVTARAILLGFVYFAASSYTLK